jgi:hypothetical protein
MISTFNPVLDFYNNDSPYFLKNSQLKSTKMFTKKLVLPITAMLFAIVLGSCQKEQMPVSTTNLTDAATTTLALRDKPIQQLQGIDLGLACSFEILSKSGITNVYKSTVTGDIGTSPITGAAIGLTCSEVLGTIYTVNAAGPLPCRVTNASRLTTAVLNMQTAYTNAAGRSNPNFLNLGAGNIGGKTLTPGLYKWTTALVIPTNITIAGGPNDIWIFQVAGTLDMSSAVNVTLSGGAKAKNIFWQTAGAVTLGTTSHFEGNILSQTGINLQTGASINGRLLAQTAVTLQMNTVKMPQ